MCNNTTAKSKPSTNYEYLPKTVSQASVVLASNPIKLEFETNCNLQLQK